MIPRRLFPRRVASDPVYILFFLPALSAFTGRVRRTPALDNDQGIFARGHRAGAFTRGVLELCLFMPAGSHLGALFCVKCFVLRDGGLARWRVVYFVVCFHRSDGDVVVRHPGIGADARASIALLWPSPVALVPMDRADNYHNGFGFFFAVALVVTNMSVVTFLHTMTPGGVVLYLVLLLLAGTRAKGAGDRTTA